MLEGRTKPVNEESKIKAMERVLPKAIFLLEYENTMGSRTRKKSLNFETKRSNIKYVKKLASVDKNTVRLG